MQSLDGDEYIYTPEDTSEDEYDPRSSSSASPSTPKRRQKSKTTTPAKRTRHTKAQSGEGQGSVTRTLSLYSLPAEIVDAILYDSSLRVHDHMALARVCRALRAVYYHPPPNNSASGNSFSSPVWAALVAQRPFEGQGRAASSLYSNYGTHNIASAHPTREKEKRLKHLWSGRFDETKMVILGSRRTPEKRTWDRAYSTYVTRPAKHEKMLIRSIEWDEAIESVAKQRITKTTARSGYKLSESELGQLPYVEKRNPHYRSAAPMQLYVEAKVERLAYKLHGGYQGHLDLLKKLADRAGEAAQTRRDKAAGIFHPLPTPPKTPTRKGVKAGEPAVTPGWRQLTPTPERLAERALEREREETPTPLPTAIEAATGTALAFGQEQYEPRTPPRGGQKRKHHDEMQQQQQQLPTPLSPLVGAAQYGFPPMFGHAGLSEAGPSSPTPATRTMARSARARASGAVKGETGTSGVKQEEEDQVTSTVETKTLVGALKSSSLFFAASAEDGDSKMGMATSTSAADTEEDAKPSIEENALAPVVASGRPRRIRAKRDYSVFA
ncbi:hypothetical protein JCM10908_005712 [Rhodotorula pacifica]|uniref:uncharacterized protein n=1 Tax=Rhodotorula pacifica TaxID=1495444 RepID=UPI00316D93F4